MESNSNVLVAVRIRPLNTNEIQSGIKSCCQTLGEKVITIKKNGDASQYLKSQQLTLNEYGFDVVFDESSTQHSVYEKTTKGYIPLLMMGQNVTVFAYGATGAGKTHTMLGNTRTDAAAERAEAGIIPNSVKDLFQTISMKKTSLNSGESYEVCLNFLEVYNEQVYDLLDNSGKVLSVREDQERGIVVVAGITEQIVTSYEQVIELIIQGNRQRKTEATMANAVSSRSHAVLQLTLRHSKRSESGRETVIESKLSLIDLAGSERASATNNRGVRLQEGASINKSLLALANCINALAENSNTGKKLNVKYRDSKLTHLLKSSLEGNCNLIMIANINPSDQTYEDSHNTLKYANRAKNIKVNPTIKESSKEQTWMEREIILREENKCLRARVDELLVIVSDLQSFKDSVLKQGIIPPESTISQTRKSISFDCSGEMNISISSLSSGQDNLCDFQSSSDTIILDSSNDNCRLSDFHQTQEQILIVPPIEIAPVDELPCMPTESVEVESSNPRKRRVSHLPTFGSRKRQSISSVATDNTTIATSNTITQAQPSDTLQFPSKNNLSDVAKDNNTSDDLFLKLNEVVEMPILKMSDEPILPEANSEKNILISKSFDEISEKINSNSFLDTSSVPTKITSTITRRNSIGVTTRRKSMASVSAMLNSLTQEVSSGNFDLKITNTPAPTYGEPSTPSETSEEPRMVTRSMQRQSLLPIPEEHAVSRSTTRRKSIAVSSITAPKAIKSSTRDRKSMMIIDENINHNIRGENLNENAWIDI